MKVITIESQAYKSIMEKLYTIAKYIFAIQSKAEGETEDGWVGSHEVCTFLKISSKTLQRLRAAGLITFSRIRGKSFYRISEIERLMQSNIIRRTNEHLNDLKNNRRIYVEQRRNPKADK